MYYELKKGYKKKDAGHKTFTTMKALNNDKKSNSL